MPCAATRRDGAGGIYRTVSRGHASWTPHGCQRRIGLGIADAGGQGSGRIFEATITRSVRSERSAILARPASTYGRPRTSPPTGKDALALPAREAKLLQRLLIGCGHDGHSVQITAHAAPAFRKMRVKRLGSSKRYAVLELQRIMALVNAGISVSSRCASAARSSCVVPRALPTMLGPAANAQMRV